jgi:hypothetical protein
VIATARPRGRRTIINTAPPRPIPGRQNLSLASTAGGRSALRRRFLNGGRQPALALLHIDEWPMRRGFRVGSAGARQSPRDDRPEADRSRNSIRPPERKTAMLRTLTAALLAASMIVAPALALEQSPAPAAPATAPGSAKAATADKATATPSRHAGHAKHVRHVKHAKHVRHVTHVRHAKAVKHAVKPVKRDGGDHHAATKPATKSGAN